MTSHCTLHYSTVCFSEGAAELDLDIALYLQEELTPKRANCLPFTIYMFIYLMSYWTKLFVFFFVMETFFIL